jgi:hypothetical protein
MGRLPISPGGSISALLAYRAAVGQRTRSILNDPAA